MSQGSITKRGKGYRLKYEAASAPDGSRRTRYVTFRGDRAAAKKELARLIAAEVEGNGIDPSKVTVAQHLRTWLGGNHGLSGKTVERYQQLAEQQIIPYLGATPLQRLKLAQIEEWHDTLLNRGGKNGRPLSAQTVRHAHRVLHRGLAVALRLEKVNRNVASAAEPPKIKASEVTILTSDEVAEIMTKLSDHWLRPIFTVAIGTGLRRGELLALTWGTIDFDRGVLRVERSLEQTRAGLRFKAPKTRQSRRNVSLPASTIDALKAHRAAQLALRLQLGMGRLEADDLVFSTIDGSPIPPNNLSRDWARISRSRKLPKVMLHALRHSHVSALISAGLDVLTVSQRIGHANAATTLKVYAHRFAARDDKAAEAIEAAFGAKR
jgi:integrase